MPHYFFVSFIALVLSCANSNTVSPEDDGAQENSNACSICLLSDSLVEVERLMAVLPVTESPEFNEEQLRAIMDKLHKEMDSLIVEFKKEPAFSEAEKQLEREGVYAPKEEGIAFRACKIEHPFDKITNENERENLFVNYLAYTDYLNEMNYTWDADTTQFRKEAGNYSVKVQGELLHVPFADFPAYWKRVEDARNETINYINTKRNESVEPLAGKLLEDLSAVELLMFEFHAQAERDQYEKINRVAWDDTQLTKLHSNFWKCMKNEMH